MPTLVLTSCFRQVYSRIYENEKSILFVNVYKNFQTVLQNGQGTTRNQLVSERTDKTLAIALGNWLYQPCWRLYDWEEGEAIPRGGVPGSSRMEGYPSGLYPVDGGCGDENVYM
jgi:hypothetical protein